jgi:putative ATP-dependent endonuclease of OLD family
MRIKRILIENFRCINHLDVELGDTTVFIGPNNVGKTAILDAVRIVLTRRWGQRGSGFTANDVHKPDQVSDPRTLPPVVITLFIEEPTVGEWDADMVADLDDILALSNDGRNLLTLRVTCGWNADKETFDPAWQFLNERGEAMPERRRSVNLTGFFSYMPLFWLGALRDANNEFDPRTGHWGRLLKSVRIPDELQTEAMQILATLDARIAAADPRLASIADQIGQAARVAIGEGPGAARVNTLPVAMEEMLQRTGIVLRSEELRPWLPLSHHGQGLQSLSVIFLFQAAVIQQLEEAERPGVEAIFAIEEPEAHLHPQAARTLWEQVRRLSGQTMMTTHSPYFVQNVPLHDIRIVCLRNGTTEVASLPSVLESQLPWNDSVEGFVRARGKDFFRKNQLTNTVTALRWFDGDAADSLLRCYRSDPSYAQWVLAVPALRCASRVLPSAEDEEELSFHGRRVRGEIFFARRWILVEGVTEYLLLHALGRALDWSLDNHGVSVIDFQQSGNAGIYPALADGFRIPWHMICDGDGESAKFRQQLLDRGFDEAGLVGKFVTLTAPHDLEDQMIADGHSRLLRGILSESCGPSVLTCSDNDFLKRLKNRKTAYMAVLAMRIASDQQLAERMPAPFVDLIRGLKEGRL